MGMFAPSLFDNFVFRKSHMGSNNCPVKTRTRGHRGHNKGLIGSQTTFLAYQF
jgi:hypothetical protein